MSGRISVRLAKSKDADGLSEMNRAFNGPQIDAAVIASKLLTGNEYVAVSLCNGVPVGFACALIHDSFCYHKPYAELTELYVKDAFRRLKAGTKLVHFMESHLRRRHVVHMHVLTGARNKAGRSLYESLGYKTNRKRREVLYEKDIVPHRVVVASFGGTPVRRRLPTRAGKA
jgi:ribosomal protein S18 acetylase RimI-like enzyme